MTLEPTTPPTQSPTPQAHACDGGPELLPGMEHFVGLLRKVKQPSLVLVLLARISGQSLSRLAALAQGAFGVLPSAERTVWFEEVARWPAAQQQRLQNAAERVVLLDDDYGAQATSALLDAQSGLDAEVLQAPLDRYSRALHLLLLQDFPLRGAPQEQRFDQAERQQALHRQWRSECFTSHYLGPKGVVPTLSAEVKALLRQRIAQLYALVDAEQILIESFTRAAPALTGVAPDPTDRTPAHTLVQLHTVTATFNGSVVHFKRLSGGEVHDVEEPAAVAIHFSWEARTGALGVYCEDKGLRQDLATLFGELVLACAGPLHSMAMREFNLVGFSTQDILARLQDARIEGVQAISILQVRIAHPLEARATDEANARVMAQQLTSSLLMSCDRRDQRHIYQVAQHDYGLDDLSGFTLSQVKLVLHLAAQTHRRAHSVAVQITWPNGLNDTSKTEDDRRCVLAQLGRLGVLCDA